MAAKQECKGCGTSHPKTEKYFYLYPNRAPICKVQESARQKARALKTKKSTAKKTSGKKRTAKKS